MNDPSDDPLDDLTEEFARRWREGERPSVEEYAARYPHWADDLRVVLPGVVLMEQLKPRCGDSTPAGFPPPCTDRPPERVGEYRILREIGRGGMGVVYEAEHEALGRRVAIKVLPRHLLANEKSRARFRREAQAAARLHHTNIVPVFGVGESDAHCFYVMQLIDGRGLDQVIRELRARQPGSGQGDKETRRQGDKECKEPLGLTGTPPAVQSAKPDSSSPGLPVSLSPCLPVSLSPCLAAQIGLQVADALAYAHAQGVLHRDVKPSNLLLDSGGAVWVTDFGVAKLVEEAHVTGSGEVVGTLKYMPPERFSGQSDARGDVYSLGVTLYELLTLQPAFPDTTPQHLIQLITQEAPLRPRKLNTDVPRDLETIVLKAAARDPAHRYQTAGELAGDLRRFLDDRPILARRAGLTEQAWRWCRRNPALAAATVATFLLMVAVTVVSMVAYAKTAAANRETALAIQEMEQALGAEKAQREHAEGAFTLALDALNRIYNRFAPTRLVVTPQASDEEGTELPLQPAFPPEAVPLMEDLLRTYQQIAHSSGEFPKLHAQAAEANYRIGDIRQRLGRFEDAATAYRAALDLYTRLLDEATEDFVLIKLARTYLELGRTLRSLQQLDEADRMYAQAIQILTHAPPALVNRPECRYELARLYYTLGQRDQPATFRALGPERPPRPGEPEPRSPGAGRKPPPPRDGPPGLGPKPPPRDRPPGPERSLNGDHPAQHAIVLLEQLVGEFPTVPEYRHLLACCYRDLPPPRHGRGQPPPGPNRERALELLRQLVKDFPKVPDYRFDLCETLGRPRPPERPEEMTSETEKQARLEEAVALSTALVAEYPNLPDYAAARARYLEHLGVTLFLAQQADGAEKLLQEAVAIQQRLVKQYPEVVAYGFWTSMMERSLGHVLSERGEWRKARTQLETAIGRLERLRQKDPRLGAVRPLLGMAYRDLAEALTQGGEATLAAAARRQSAEFETERARDPFNPRPRSDLRP